MCENQNGGEMQIWLHHEGTCVEYVGGWISYYFKSNLFGLTFNQFLSLLTLVASVHHMVVLQCQTFKRTFMKREAWIWSNLWIRFHFLPWYPSTFSVQMTIWSDIQTPWCLCYFLIQHIFPNVASIRGRWMLQCCIWHSIHALILLKPHLAKENGGKPVVLWLSGLFCWN